MAYKPYKHYNSESGIAYAWFVLTVFIIIAGILLAFYYGVINSILNGPRGDQSIGVNHDIKEGKQSQQSRAAIQFNVDFATNIPFFFVIGCLVFAVARAIVVKKVP